MATSSAHHEIERALVALSRKVTDPRGNRRINEMAGADIERAGATMLSRIDDLEPARLSDLACAAGVDVSTASRQVARLVELGFVGRVPDPEDRRAARHSLTPEGRAVRERLLEARHEWIESIVVDLSRDERTVLGDLLGRVIDRMDEVESTRTA